MTKENVETIKMLCGYASSRKQVIKSFVDSYPEIPEKEIAMTVEKYWLNAQTEKHTLAGKALKTKILILRNLLMQKRLGEITKVMIPLVKDIQKKLPLDIYTLIIKETSSKREKLRGTYVELTAISDDGIQLLVSDVAEFTFTVYDINCSKKLILL